MNDLELLREMFSDTRLHIGIGTIKTLGLSKDGNTLRMMVNLLPENREIVVVKAWSDVSSITFPEVNDLVITASVDGHPDETFAISVLSTKEEPIPKFAQALHSIYYSRPGRKAYLGSDVKVGVGRPGVEPTEPLVLGNTLVSGLAALVNAFLNASQIGQSAVGPVYLDPAVRTALQNFVTTFLNTSSSNIISQIAFSERGV